MKLNTKKIVKGFTLVELLVVIAIIAALAALATPVVLKQQKKAAATEAINNAKQIFLLMFEHDQDTGAYPATGTTSNLNFQKLITDAYTTSEDVFYAKTDFTVKPDGNATGTNAVAAGECGFLYVEGNSSTAPSATPIVGSPQTTAAAGAVFDPEAFGGTAIVLRNDGGVKTFRIPTGGVILDETTGTASDVFTAAKLNGGAIVPPITKP